MPKFSRDYILESIRETAAANGGIALGRTRFEDETGIGPWHWGKFWARFSEAQAEAGLQPRALNSPFDQDRVLRPLALLVRDKGRFPTVAEMRVRRSEGDETFPDPGVFRRFGGQAELVEALLGFCTGHPDFQDVGAICTARKTPASRKRRIEPNADDHGLRVGFVYLMNGHPGEFKIGRTNLVDRRIAELGAKAAVEPALVHEIKTDDPEGVEAYWHRRFASKRMRGEWFKLDAADVRAFMRWRRIH